MSGAGLVRDLLRELDAVLRVVAPAEHPVAASPLVLTFAECGIEPDFVPRLRGFAADNLDTFAAWLRGDESLVGRPVVALAVDRTVRSFTFAGTLNREAALEELRDSVLHELAHSVARQAEAPAERVDPASFPAWIRGQLSSVAAADRFADPTTHGPNWWTRYVVLTARLAAVAPRLYPRKSFASAVNLYGYGHKHDAAAWIAAASADADLLSGSIMDATSRRATELMRLLDDIRPRAAEPVSVAASQRA